MASKVERYSKKHTLAVTLPNGIIKTRKTDRVYRFVVAAGDDGKWGAFSWNSRRDLAEKKLEEFRGWNPTYEFQIIPVQQPE